MPRKKLISTHYDEAIARKSALKSIDANLDLGSGLTIEFYENKIKDLRDKLDDYNMYLSVIDEKRSLVMDSEKELRDVSERMLGGVAVKYGKNSEEYEKAGGTKKSNRAHPKKKPPINP